MTDTYGPIAIPLVAAPDGRDDLTHYLASFLQAVGNAKALAEYTNTTPSSPPRPPIARFYTHDPEVADFSEMALPALYVIHRETTSFADESEDIRVERGRLEIVWVPIIATQDAARRRFNFAQKLVRVWDAALQKGRDPSWVVDGDTYYGAATNGSFVSRYAKFRKLRLSTARRRAIAIPIQDGEPRRYEAYSVFADYELELKIDLAAAYDELDGVDLEIAVPAGEPPEDLPELTVIEASLELPAP